jgi:hypothetical protein
LPEKEIDHLYSKPLDEFTAARDALARDLRKAGDKASADEIKALRKPTISAWAINQLVRKERMKIRSLLVAGEKLRSAHAEVLAGAQPAKLREATEAERKAIAHLLSSAAAVLSQAGHAVNESTLDRVATTLQAAAVDEEGRALLEQGRLTGDLDPTGFGPLAGVTIPKRRAKDGQDRAGDRDRDRRRKAQAAEEKLRALRAELRDLAKAAADADGRVAGARQALRTAEQEAKGARRKHERAERRLKDAETELAKLRRRA